MSAALHQPQHNNHALAHLIESPIWLGGILLLCASCCLTYLWLKSRRECRRLKQACWNLQAMITHEIRTPLDAIVKLLKLATDADTTLAQQHVLLENTQNSALAMLKLLDDMLTQYTLESGKLPLHLQAAHLPDLLQELCNVYGSIAREKKLRFTLSCDYEISDLQLDELKLRQILGNLLSNAIKFTPRGHITLQVKSYPAERAGWAKVEIDVIDSGIGMSEAVRKELFTPFGAAGDAARHAYGGNGLGLCLCQQLVQLMDGKIEIESQPGLGTQVHLHFEARKAEARPRTPPPQFPGATALIADDDPASRMLLKLQLEQHGIAVRCCSDGRQAFRDWALHGCDIVFCDLHMPQLNGEELIMRIRKLERRRKATPVPIITISGSNIHGQLLDAVNDTLSKPVVASALTRTLLRSLPGSSADIPSTCSPVRHDVLRQLAQENTEFEKNFIQAVLKNNKADLDSLTRAHEEQDLEKAAETLHRLHGMARLLGSDDMIDHCRMLNDAIQNHNRTQMRRWLLVVTRETQAVNGELEQRLTGMARPSPNGLHQNSRS